MSTSFFAGRVTAPSASTSAGTVVLTILGCVVYLSEAGDGRWLAGCNFIRELDDQELQKLT